MICDDWQWYEKTSYDAYTGNVTGLVAIFHISFHICFCWGTEALLQYIKAMKIMTMKIRVERRRREFSPLLYSLFPYYLLSLRERHVT